jgi:hypothetical protein
VTRRAPAATTDKTRRGAERRREEKKIRRKEDKQTGGDPFAANISSYNIFSQIQIFSLNKPWHH